MMYVSEIIRLYTLKLYSAMYQLYLNKTGKEKKYLETIRPVYILNPILIAIHPLPISQIFDLAMQ